MTSLDVLSSTFKSAANRHFATSEFYSSLALRIAEDEDVLRIAGKATPGLFPPLLLFTAVHSLVLEYRNAPLAQFFSTVTGKPVPKIEPYPVFRDFVLEYSKQITRLIQSANINKAVIKRSACLRALLVKVATENGWKRVHLVDIGCSAGFNLFMDEWRITYQGAGSVGPADSPVHFSIDLHDDIIPPLGDTPELLSRTGIDLDAFDLTNDAHERWLLGGLIPDQLETFEATKRALPVLRRHAPHIIEGDAGVELPAVLNDLPGREPVVVMHSLMLHHLSLKQKQAIFKALRHASTLRPVARISMELSTANSVLSIATGNGSEPMLVGEADDDSAWMRWY